MTTAIETPVAPEVHEQPNPALLTGAGRMALQTEMMIPVSQLHLLPPDPDFVPFKKENVANLAKSIESDGLIHRPVVQPVSVPNGSGQVTKYQPISGSKRIYAMTKILGWQEIPCMVVDGLDAELAKSAEIAGNLFAMGLSPEQMQKSLVEWHRIYANRHPLATGKGVGAKKEQVVEQRVSEIINAKVEAGEVTAVTPEVVEAVKADVKAAVDAEAKPFYQVLMETLNISASAATRLSRVARNLTKDQIGALHANKVTGEIIDKLAMLADEEEINKAIKLIASGMDHTEAIRQSSKIVKEKKKEKKAAEQAAKDVEYTAKTGKPAEARAPKVKAEPKKKESDLTDEEWLQDHCGTLMGQLKRKAAFKRDAILYRRLIPHLARVRTEWTSRINECKSPDGNGGFFYAVNRFVKAKHPSQWFLCETCSGSGKAPPKEGAPADAKAEKCITCLGAAYKVAVD